MISPYPKTAQEFKSLSWAQIEPYYQELADRPIDASNVSAWLADWTYLSRLVYETQRNGMVKRLKVFSTGL